MELFTIHGYEATTMADIGQAVGMRGPSLYKHVGSKQDLLAQIMVETMRTLLTMHRSAVSSAVDVTERLRRATEAHVRFHARHRLEAFVGNREIRSLIEPNRSEVLALRVEYETCFRQLIEAGIDDGRFQVASTQLASFAILDLGMGVAAWYRPDGEVSEDALVWQYSDFALRLVGATVQR
ncbi:TetR family transcriptional regulator [Mycobacterium colombiense CECT 3035]|uniref:TetR family transcriptional regulator n=1 Tax=Mycobacterium colombiense CECT 3035 TaxID=1041522 RepID=J4JVP3_9MYCO|nr:TetR family transcriptional regulator [Mycobacterium colombiense CECT 3035]